MAATNFEELARKLLITLSAECAQKMSNPVDIAKELLSGMARPAGALLSMNYIYEPVKSMV
jgi:hypothetical protein